MPLGLQHTRNIPTWRAFLTHSPSYRRNAIIGFCSLALEDGDLPPPIDSYVEGSLQGARNLLSLLSQIIEFSKIVHGVEDEVEVDHIELAKDPFSIVQVCCDLIDIISFRVRP